ncbi:MAG: LptF/LptG family permease [Phycisphaeraceae bacterium]|nr:LptF/LptG family permease [Phycisphaeraceae bacterium]
MRLLDRYIARQFFVNVLVLFVLLFSFVVAIDVSLNVHRFIHNATKLARGGSESEPSGARVAVVTAFLVADLWWPRLLQLFNFMLGLVMVAAMGFTLTQLVRHRELVAMLASGLSLRRVAAPILVVAFVMTGVQALNQEFALPRIAPLLARDTGQAGQHTMGASRVPLVADTLGRVWYARAFDADTGTLEDVYVWERDAQGMAVCRIHADRARWRGGGWDLDGGIAESRTNRAEPAVRVDRIETNLDPTELRVRRHDAYRHALSWGQLGQMLRVLDRLDRNAPEVRAKREQIQRERWGRVSIMASNVLALLIALPFFLSRTPGNMLVRTLRCAPVAIVSLLGGILGASAPVPGLPAALGVFVPTAVLGLVAVASLSTIRT